MTTTIRKSPAPIVTGSEALPEAERVVLAALRRRRRQYDAGYIGAPTPALRRDELVRALRSHSVLDASDRPSRPFAGMSDRRLRHLVERLRLAQHPIVSASSTPGYWLSDDPVEIRECAQTLRVKPDVARAMLRAAAAVEAQRAEGALAPVQGGLL